MLKNFLIATALMFGLTATPASAVTIDFGNHDNPNFDVGETYTEDGFTFEVISGDQFGIYAGHSNPVGNPASGLSVGRSDPVGDGDTISITADSGNLFSFDSVDYASYSSVQSDSVDLVGLVNGVIVATFSGLSSNTPTFATLNPLFATLIDELQIIGSPTGYTMLELDNFVFSEVPLPAALWMFLAGLGGLGFARRTGSS